MIILRKIAPLLRIQTWLRKIKKHDRRTLKGQRRNPMILEKKPGNMKPDIELRAMEFFTIIDLHILSVLRNIYDACKLKQTKNN